MFNPHPVEYKEINPKAKRWWDSLSVEEKDLFIGLIWDIELSAFGIVRHQSSCKYLRLYDQKPKRLDYGQGKESLIKP